MINTVLEMDLYNRFCIGYPSNGGVPPSAYYGNFAILRKESPDAPKKEIRYGGLFLIKNTPSMLDYYTKYCSLVSTFTITKEDYCRWLR
jgi:hypothetical protein